MAVPQSTFPQVTRAGNDRIAIDDSDVVFVMRELDYPPVGSFLPREVSRSHALLRASQFDFNLCSDWIAHIIGVGILPHAAGSNLPRSTH